MHVFHLILVFHFLISASLVSSRGPHHPRGAKIVKRHTHSRPSKDRKLTEDIDVLHDKEHIQEHLEEIISEPDISKMTDDELEFYFFQLHDTDKNLKLDGLEILQAILHTTEHDDEEHEEELADEANATSAITFDSHIDLIDRVLTEDDFDNDGYLSYEEYKTSRRASKMNELKSYELKMIAD